MSSASNARLLKATADCLSRGKPNGYIAQVRSSGFVRILWIWSLQIWSLFWWSHFRWILPLGYFHVPLTWFSIHFCACLIHFFGSTHVCAVRFIFCPVRLMLVQLIYFYAFRFICMQFDSFLWGSIHLFTVQFMCVPVRSNFCVVRFIFAWFDSFFAVLIFCDRFLFYLCAFHIVHFVAWRFCP